MRLVIKLAQLNIEHQTGGPFGAGIFESRTGRSIVDCRLSIADWSGRLAGLIQISPAIRLAGKNRKSKIENAGRMCLGAIPWSGVQSLVCGARDEDARRIGFDEGTKPDHWVESLESRGIRVLRDVLREQAQAMLLDYQKRGGLIYNARKGVVIKDK